MIERIAHIAIAVRDLETSKKLFGKLLGVPVDHEEVVEQQHVRTAIFRVGETALELLEGTDSDSSVRKFVEKKGEGIHHISFVVDDVAKEADRLKQAGFELVGDPRPGVEDTLVAFFHPRSTNGVLIEISQNMGEKKAGKD